MSFKKNKYKIGHLLIYVYPHKPRKGQEVKGVKAGSFCPMVITGDIDGVHFAVEDLLAMNEITEKNFKEMWEEIGNKLLYYVDKWGERI